MVTKNSTDLKQNKKWVWDCRGVVEIPPGSA